jgi:hypothetical protein
LLIWFGVYPAPLLEMIQRNAVPSVAELLAPESDMLMSRNERRLRRVVADQVACPVVPKSPHR